MPSNRISIADLATELEVSGRRLRRTTRAMKLGVGKGKKYALTAKQADKVRNRINPPVEEAAADAS